MVFGGVAHYFFISQLRGLGREGVLSRKYTCIHVSIGDV